jgi:hypothetical protein
MILENAGERIAINPDRFDKLLTNDPTYNPKELATQKTHGGKISMELLIINLK